MIRKIKYKLREWRYSIADLFGFPLRLKGREGAVQIICFHGVCEDHQPLINGRFMHVSRFRSLLEAIQSNFNILSYDDFLNGHKDPNRLNILITFDDGYRNFTTLAFPVMRELGIPSVMFINNPEEHALWPDLFDIAMAKVEKGTALMRNVLPQEAPTDSHQWRRWLMEQHTETIVGFTRSLRETLPEKILQENAVFHELLSDEELVQLHQSGLVTLGNHGANHLSYPSITESEREQDLKVVTERLQRVGCEQLPFAYPYANHDAVSAENLRAWGYPVQFVADTTVIPELHTRIAVHPLFSVGNQLRYIYRGYF